MSRFGNTLLIVAFVLAAGDGWAQSGAKTMSASEAAAEYSRLLTDLDAATSGDAEVLLELSPELLMSFEIRLRELDLAARAARGHAGSIVAVQKNDKARLVNENEVIPLVQMLGESSLRISAAANWARYWLRDENKKFFDARMEAENRSQREVARVYFQYQQAVLARESAMQQLSGILSGRLKVVADGTGGRRDANYGETLAYVAGLQAEASSGIYIIPPHVTKSKDLFAIERLELLKKQLNNLTAFRDRVRGELGRLAGEHQKQVLAILSRPDKAGTNDRAAAVLSLGSWNEKGVALALANINDKSVELRHAGLAALSRLDLNLPALNSLKTHPHPLARRAAIGLIQNRIHELDASAQALQPLLIDDERAVRLEAYAALDHIAELRHDQKGEIRKLAIVALDPKKDWKVVLDAIEWIDKHGGSDDPKVAEARQKSFNSLQRYHPKEAAHLSAAVGRG